MAATQISQTPTFGGSRPMTRTQSILLETMQLVEPQKSMPVPNHLLDSKIYSKLAQNSTVQARPAVIHFGGFELGQVQRQILHLANVSTEVQRMHIIPPQTRFFTVKYTKNDRLVPGLTLECTIEFVADEWRYYYDCIRIHCKGEENLVIPIHAYPVMGTDDFPSSLDFPPVPIGHRETRVIPLRCTAPIDFEFQLSVIQPHAAFTVDPLAGVVPANDEVDITVTFAPSEFCTAHMKLQLLISQFNAKPLVCSITGTSAPGLAKDLTEASYKQEEDFILDPRCITPVERARSKRKQRKQKSAPKAQQEAKPTETEKDGVRFPSNLDTPYSVAQVLNQEPGKLRIKDLREAVIAKKGDVVGSTRQMKEAMFDVAVRQDVYEERQNQLRWQIKLGDDQITAQARQEILAARDAAWREYKLQRGDPVEEEEYNRTCTKCTFRRTTRDASQVGQEGVKFDTYTNDMWAVRHAALSRFQQAARKIIIRARAAKNIKSLKDTILNWSKRHSAASKIELVHHKEEMGGQEEKEQEELLQAPRIKSVSFPTYAPPNVKDDMAVDALGVVPFKPTEVIVKRKVPFFDLKVPQQYQLMGYRPHDAHSASLTYEPPNLAKPLRTGAEDEVINLPAPVLSDSSPEPIEPINEGDLRVEEVVETPVPPTEHIPLRPPQTMFKPIDYPPLHIFNPAPGLQVFQPPLPYAETDVDFHLCPLPRYTTTDVTNPTMATQKRYLDREDVIKGVMTWKRFPSQGLTSLANTPTLTNVWVPRWRDPFSDDLLPEEVPTLFDGLAEDDKENIHDEDEDDNTAGLQLMPEMVNAQFPLINPEKHVKEKEKEKNKKEDAFPHGNKMPSTNIPVSSTGPVPREQRERELEFFLKKKYNRLGGKFQSRIDNLNNLKTNPDLILQ